ncbi:tetratricopeptide repeat protein [Leptothrix discophora]|uniref:Tetratricopeptide repeat protein n=1 Tax=Leptothrix discophora TaxID=89 RepID=A0ABT9G7J0_LEPDI|nr:tetratricopeptide repeat protein [Leptothrix discophora]MDP4302449.1 tetratricopeptide repeat protein [Leptothrix discophora]
MTRSDDLPPLFRTWIGMTLLGLALLGLALLAIGPARAQTVAAEPATVLQQADARIAAGQPGEAVALLQGLADQGDRGARTRLARLHETGQGVPKDESLAASLYERAAHQGDPDAQFAIAAMFREGRGVEKDHLLASVWIRRAAANGHARARAQLGLPPLAPGATSPR